MRRSVLSLIIGLVLAGAAVLFMSNYLNAPKSGPQTAGAIPMAPVVVAKDDMPFGTPVRKELLQVVEWPQGSIPEGTFAGIDEIFAGAAAGSERIALRLIGKGEPVMKAKVSGFGERATLSRRVASDKRAVSIRINDVSGVAGFLLPGDHVDVMLTRQVGDERVTDVILQNMTILGIDQLSDDDRDKPVLARTATVEAATDEAQKLALAQELGSLSLALRNAESIEKVTTNRVGARDLVSIREKPPQQPVTVRIRYADGSVVYREVRP